MHQLFMVTSNEQLQQQLRMDEEVRGKVAETLTRQWYFLEGADTSNWKYYRGRG
jgi:hypothetical protein